MKLDEIVISRAIIERYTNKLLSCLNNDVAIVGGGPAGLVAGYFLAKAEKNVVLFDKKLSIGGGMWGGGMMFNEIVVQEEGKKILDLFDIETKKWQEGYYTADSIESVSAICFKAIKAGLKIFNLITVEDVVIRENKVDGLVINWTSVEMAGLHVDPLTIKAKFIIDATGHDTEVIAVIQKKVDTKLLTPSGKIEGEKSMWAEIAEQKTIENTKEAFPGVFVAGMAANATFGSFRMGPIFGGMLLSGKKAAELIIERL